jgi:hypothetical protein
MMSAQMPAGKSYFDARFDEIIRRSIGEGEPLLICSDSV